MEVPILQFIRGFESRLRFIHAEHPNFSVYMRLTFPNEDTALTFDNEMSLEEDGSPVFDWTLWNAEETEIRAYDACEECETDEGWCETNVTNDSFCSTFVRFSPIVDNKCTHNSVVWQKEGSFGDIASTIIENIGLSSME